LTDRFGWQAVFLINPPLALGAVALLWIAAPADAREPRRFDVVGAGLIACALGALAFALSELGRSAPHEAGSIASGTTAAVAGVLGVAGLGIFAWWEGVSSHPMTPPRLAENRLFVGLNAATLLIYAGLSIMFFLLPFDLVDRRGLSPTSAGLALVPFVLGMGLLSPLFGGLANTFGARRMLIAGSLGASIAYLWMMLTQTASLTFGVLAPLAWLGIAFAVLVAPLTDAVMSSVPDSDEGLASGVNNAISRVAQLAGVALAAGLGSLSFGYRLGFVAAAALSAAGAVTTALEVPPGPRAKGSRT
jgi:predicted MFS family arabinose efflux permease